MEANYDISACRHGDLKPLGSGGGSCERLPRPPSPPRRASPRRLAAPRLPASPPAAHGPASCPTDIQRLIPQPVVKIGDDSRPETLPLAAWYAEKPPNTVDEDALELKVLLRDEQSVAFFDDLDARNREALGEAWHKLNPRKGSATEQGEKYKSTLWRRNDGKISLIVNVVKAKEASKHRPTAFFNAGTLGGSTRPERCEASQIKPNSRLVIKVEMLWIWSNSTSATMKVHAKEVLIFDPPEEQASNGMSLYSSTSRARIESTNPTDPGVKAEEPEPEQSGKRLAVETETPFSPEPKRPKN